MFDILANLVAFFYQVTKSYGLSIILLTVCVRLAMFPLTAKQAKSMQAMQRVQPEIKKLQARYKDDRQKLNEELMKFYRENKINPAAGCLPLLVQAPVLYIMFRVIRGLTASKSLDWLMIRVPKPDYLSSDSDLYRALVNAGGRMVSWGIDLAKSPQSQSGADALPYYLLVLAVVLTGVISQRQVAARSSTTNNPQARQMQTIMKIMPIFFGFITFSMQAGLIVYWLTGNVFTIAQQWIIFRKNPTITPPADEVIESTAHEKPTLRRTDRPRSGARAALGRANGTDVSGTDVSASGPASSGTSGSKTGSGRPSGPKAGGAKSATPRPVVPRPGVAKSGGANSKPGSKTPPVDKNPQPWVKTGQAKSRKRGKR